MSLYAKIVSAAAGLTILFGLVLVILRVIAASYDVADRVHRPPPVAEAAKVAPPPTTTGSIEKRKPGQPKARPEPSFFYHPLDWFQWYLDFPAQAPPLNPGEPWPPRTD